MMIMFRKEQQRIASESALPWQHWWQIQMVKERSQLNRKHWIRENRSVLRQLPTVLGAMTEVIARLIIIYLKHERNCLKR
jgi:hypothetical protein